VTKVEILNYLWSCAAAKFSFLLDSFISWSDMDFATGDTISQQLPEDDKWHLITFFSKSLSLVEWNYQIHDKEMLAIIWALEEWRYFLEGAQLKFEIWMDHKNLEYFRSSKTLNQTQAWWSLYLSRFNFTLHHCLGWTMGKTNALSQRSDHGSGTEDNSDMTLLWPELFVRGWPNSRQLQSNSRTSRIPISRSGMLHWHRAFKYF